MKDMMNELLTSFASMLAKGRLTGSGNIPLGGGNMATNRTGSGRSIDEDFYRQQDIFRHFEKMRNYEVYFPPNNYSYVMAKISERRKQNTIGSPQSFESCVYKKYRRGVVAAIDSDAGQQPHHNHYHNFLQRFKTNKPPTIVLQGCLKDLPSLQIGSSVGGLNNASRLRYRRRSLLGDLH